MRRRRWVAWVAVLGVLVHATMLVRHATAVVAAGLQHHDLLVALGVICHGAGGETRLAASDLPAPPRPGDDGKSCPICAGQISASAVLTGLESPTFVTVALDVSPATEWQAPDVTRHAARPPGRAPPVGV